MLWSFTLLKSHCYQLFFYTTDLILGLSILKIILTRSLLLIYQGPNLPWASMVAQWQEGPAYQCRRREFSPWRRKGQPTPVLLPGKSHGQRSLVGYSPWGRKESDMTEWRSCSCHFLAEIDGEEMSESWIYWFEGNVNTCFSFFCSTNGQYVKQGKFGAAVLGNHTTREVSMPPCLMYIQVSQIIPVNWFLWGLGLYIRGLEWLYLIWIFNVRCIMIFIVTFCLLLCIKTNSTTQIP